MQGSGSCYPSQANSSEQNCRLLESLAVAAAVVEAVVAVVIVAAVVLVLGFLAPDGKK